MQIIATGYATNQTDVHCAIKSCPNPIRENVVTKVIVRDINRPMIMANNTPVNVNIIRDR